MFNFSCKSDIVALFGLVPLTTVDFPCSKFCCCCMEVIFRFVLQGSLDSSLKKDYSLRSKRFVSSIKSPGNQSGTLHKFGYFLQTSPTVIYSKGKRQAKENRKY